jgi:hypothetical protein
MSTTIAIPSADQLNWDCVTSIDNAMHGIRREITHGVLRSRGKWIRVIANGDSVVDNGMEEWKGTQQQLDKLIEQYRNYPGLQGIYIEGGVDWAATNADFRSGDYEPWVADWAVDIYLPE